MAKTQGGFSARRATRADLRAAEALVSSYRRRLATTVLGAWEEQVPVLETVDELAALVRTASPSAGGHGQQLYPHLVGQAQLHGAA